MNDESLIILQAHTWDVHVWAVDVFPWRQKQRPLAIRRHWLLLARPRSMAPGEENDEELVDDIGVGDIEVVFEAADIDIAIELSEVSICKNKCDSYGWRDKRTFCSMYS